MKAPTWGLITGSLMMLFGGCGALNDIQLIQSDKILAIQEDIVSNMSKKIEQQEQNDAISDTLENSSDKETGTIIINNDTIDTNNIEESIGKLIHISDYMKKWMVRLGYIGLIVSTIYFLGGLFLIVIKEWSIQLAYFALTLSIVFGLFQIFINSQDDSSSLVNWASNIGYYFSIGADIILLAVVFASDKSEYIPESYED